MIRPLALLVTLVAGPATAQCDGFANTPVASFTEVNGRSGSFVMVFGRFSDGALLGEVYALAADGSATTNRVVEGHFEGMRATAQGFVDPLDSDVRIVQRCTADACHPRLDGTRYLAFFERVGGRLEFSEDGCGLRAYAEPTPEVLESMVRCMAGGACE